MNAEMNTQIRVREIPSGALTPEHFEIATAALPEPAFTWI